VVCCWSSLVVWLMVVVLVWPHHGSVLTWDEVDYVNAAGLGIAANAFERGSLSPLDFVQFALSKAAKRSPTLPPGYDEERDPFILRHGHPPFVVFLLAVLPRVRSERVVRSVQLLGALLLIGTMFLAYQSMAGSAGWFGMLLVSAFALWISCLAFGLLSFHGWEAIWATLAATFLVLLGRSPGVGDTRLRLGLCTTLALALLTLETGLLVWLGVGLWLLVSRWCDVQAGKSGFSPRELFLGLLVAVLVIAIAWPGAFSNISILKTVATRVYAVQLGNEYAGVAYGEITRSLLPVVVLGAPLLAWLLSSSRLNVRLWGPFVVIGVVYGVGMIPVAVQAHYLVPAVAPLACVAAAASDRLSRLWIRVGAVVLAVVAIAGAWPTGSISAFDRGAREDLHWLGDVLRGQEALVDGGHIYQYYLGRDYRIRPITVGYDGSSLSVREGGQYQALRAQDVNGRLVVIQASRKESLAGDAHRLLLERCPRIDRFTIRVYDCRGANVSESVESREAKGSKRDG
jgi:hypothetical protein